MGVGYLVLLIALVPFASSRDLRTASRVNRRTAPDPLLVQLFNDPTATSQLTKQLLDGSLDASGSGSGLWADPEDDSKLSDDATEETVTKPEPVKLANDKSTETVGSGSGAEPTTKTDNETVETKDDSVTNEDENTKKSSFIPEQTQTVTDQVEEDNGVRDSTAAPKPDMYDATIVKKNNVPKPDNAKAVSKSVIVHTPEGGLAPLTSEPTDQSQESQDLSQMAMQPQQDMPQPAMQPQQDMSQAAMQPQQDVSQAAMQPQQDMSQAAMQPQPDVSQAAMQPQPDVSQYAMQPQQDMAQAQAPVQQDTAPPQMMAPTMQNSSLYQGAPLTSDAQAQGYGQYQQQQQADYPQDSNAPAAPMDQAMMQNQGAVNPYAGGQEVDPQTGMPVAADMQSVPVFQGLKAKKVEIKEDECEDMYDSCPDMAKNEYCTNYAELMHVQCKKSCGFCEVDDDSGSGSEQSESSGSGSGMWNDDVQEGDNVVGESAAGSAGATDVWSNSASGENMIKGEADILVRDEPSATDEKKESTVEAFESGSGQEPAEIGSSAGANLAEDLATGTVSKTEEVKEKEVTVPKAKYSEIPVPRVIIQQQPAAEVYPHIDLKVIAKAVNAYKSTALRMLGEAIRDAAQEAEDTAVKRTSIPMPPATDLLKKMGFPMDEPKSVIPQYPVQPAAYAQYYQQAYAEEQAAAKAKIEKAKKKAEEEAKKKEEDEESSGYENSKIKDPYQYVRDMPKGASMQPIESRPGAAQAPRGHSDPIFLFKNSQISNEIAAKKNAIPKPSVSKFLMQQMPQPQANTMPAQPKAIVPMGGGYVQDSSLEMPANDTQGFVQPMPIDNNQLYSPMDNNAMLRSDTTTAQAQAAFVQPQGVDADNFRELQSYFPVQEGKKKRDIKAKGH